MVVIINVVTCDPMSSQASNTSKIQRLKVFLLAAYAVIRSICSLPYVQAAGWPVVFIGGQVLWAEMAGRPKMLELAVSLFPIPVCFMLWLRIAQRQTMAIYKPLSVIMCCTSIIAFASLMYIPFKWRLEVEVLGILAGCFAMVSVRECALQLIRDIKLTLVLLVGMFPAIMYFKIQEHLWTKVCHATAHVVDFILQRLIGLHVYVYESQRPVMYRLIRHHYRNGEIKITTKKIPAGDKIVTMQSDTFGIKLFPACSGMEGVFLFMFLLSCVLLIDWQIFKKRSVIDLYLMGFIYMFMVNAIRISGLFVFGHYAWQPDASHAMQLSRGVPIHVFHTWVGWVIYLVAFFIFVSILYKYTARRMQMPQQYTTQ
jgi:exosortase/archaeosortase family protein